MLKKSSVVESADATSYDDELCQRFVRSVNVSAVPDYTKPCHIVCKKLQEVRPGLVASV